MSVPVGCPRWPELHCVKWRNYQEVMSRGIRALFLEDDAAGGEKDVTLVAEGRSLRAHKWLLSICSEYFKNLFTANVNQRTANMVVIVNNNIRIRDLENVVRFMYHGEVNVASQNELDGFLRTGELLGVEGLIPNRSDDIPVEQQKSRSVPPLQTLQNSSATFATATVSAVSVPAASVSVGERLIVNFPTFPSFSAASVQPPPSTSFAGDTKPKIPISVQPVASTSTPKVKTPTTPMAKTPTTPKAKTPTTPKAKTPTTPKAKTPTTPKAKTPATPKSKTPTTPKSKTPTTPKAKTPTTPKAKTPTTPKVKTPSSFQPGASTSTPKSKTSESRKPKIPASPDLKALAVSKPKPGPSPRSRSFLFPVGRTIDLTKRPERVASPASTSKSRKSTATKETSVSSNKRPRRDEDEAVGGRSSKSPASRPPPTKAEKTSGGHGGMKEPEVDEDSDRPDSDETVNLEDLLFNPLRTVESRPAASTAVGGGNVDTRERRMMEVDRVKIEKPEIGDSGRVGEGMAGSVGELNLPGPSSAIRTTATDPRTRDVGQTLIILMGNRQFDPQQNNTEVTYACVWDYVRYEETANRVVCSFCNGKMDGKELSAIKRHLYDSHESQLRRRLFPFHKGG